LTQKFEGLIKQYGIWLLLILVVALILFVVLGESIRSTVSDRAAIATGFFAGIGILIAFVQAKWASQQAEKASQQVEQSLTTDILVSLYEMYIKRDMHRAIDDVWQAMKQEGSGISEISDFLEISDRYQFLKKYIDKQAQEGKEKEFDESRRMVAHFWYLIANLLNEGTLQEQEAFEWFGPPDVIWVLEGLEVIKQNLERIRERKKTRWPPLQVLDAYYKSKGINIEALKHVTIPIVRIEPEAIKQIKEL
jgi:hypothetical protein